MLIFKEFILLSLVILTVHAGHKRIIIKVPQRTRHIYHHHVKKVPVYVLLPDNKPKVISDLETQLVKTKPTPTPCKEPVPEFDEYSPRYRHARYSYSEKDSYHPDWIEDRDNKGAFVPIEGPKELDQEFQPPPVGVDDQIYEYGHVTSRTKKSKKYASRKSVPDPKFSKSASYQQYYSKPVPDQKHYSKPVSDQQHYSEPVSDQQHYSKPVSNQQYYSKPVSDLQHYSKLVSDHQHYSKPVSDQQQYSKPIPDQQYYSKTIADQYSKPILDQQYYSKTIADQYSKPIPDQQYYSKTIKDHYSKPISEHKLYSKSTADYQHYSKLVPEKQYDSSYESNSKFVPSTYGADSEPEYSKELEELLAFPPTASGDYGNSANSYASSYQYRINHRMDDIPTIVT